MFALALLFSALAQLSSADAIVERHIEARGGGARITALQSLMFRGEYREGDYVAEGYDGSA